MYGLNVQGFRVWGCRGFRVSVGLRGLHKGSGDSISGVI